MRVGAPCYAAKPRSTAENQGLNLEKPPKISAKMSVNSTVYQHASCRSTTNEAAVADDDAVTEETVVYSAAIIIRYGAVVEVDPICPAIHVADDDTIGNIIQKGAC